MKKKTTTSHHHQEPSNRSSTSCAACKLLKRRCGPSCIFAPYFRADEPKKFAQVHKVFGASNVSKILNEVPEEHREDTVNSLSYEAEARLRDPVYGCIGAIAILQRRMAELQHDLALARARLAGYGPGRGNSSGGSNTGCDNSHLLGVVDYCASTNSTSNCASSSSCNVASDHVRLPISQIESSQLSQTSAYSTSTNNFGQVPLLPL